jgi:hypothetical protein
VRKVDRVGRSSRGEVLRGVTCPESSGRKDRADLFEIFGGELEVGRCDVFLDPLGLPRQGAGKALPG